MVWKLQMGFGEEGKQSKRKEELGDSDLVLKICWTLKTWSEVLFPCVKVMGELNEIQILGEGKETFKSL